MPKDFDLIGQEYAWASGIPKSSQAILMCSLGWNPLLMSGLELQ